MSFVFWFLVALLLFPASSVAAPGSEKMKAPASGWAPYQVPAGKPKPLAKVPPRVKQSSLTLLDWNIQVCSDAGAF